MEGWQFRRLADVAEITMGQSPKGSSYNTTGKGVPLINGPTEFGDEAFSRTKATKFTTQPTKMCKEGDLILCVRGSTTGRMNIAGHDSCIGRGVASIRSLKYQDWINTFIDASRETIFRMGSGSTFPNVSGKLLSNIVIPIPPLPEQERIVAILDEAFAAIATATANAEKNLVNARELFESELNAVFTQKEDGWVEKTLGKVCSFQGGSQPPKSEFSAELKDGYVRLIQIRDYKTDNHIVYIPQEKARRFCSADDVMIGRYGPPLFQILRGIDGAYNVALMKAAPNEEFITKDFLYYFLKNGNILRYIIKASSRAAGQIGINKATLEPYPIAFPNKTRQTEIVLSLEDLHAKILRLENTYKLKATALAELKQSILHKAFSGELTADAKTADRTLSEAGL